MRKPRDAELLADLADVLAMTRSQRLQGEPEKLVLRALEIDPQNLKALALAGTAAFERKDFARRGALLAAHAAAGAARVPRTRARSRRNIAEAQSRRKSGPRGRAR